MKPISEKNRNAEHADFKGFNLVGASLQLVTHCK